MPNTRDPLHPPHVARILLVDDDPLITQLVVDMLSLDGHDVDTAPNGLAALNRVQRQRYDLILTDLHMPELDGIGLYRELGRRHAHPQNKIIFITGTTGTSDAHRLMQETGVPLLRKPFNLVELLALIRKMLDTP
ncbi:MAG TPA: response regulator [Methylomirabilota bacterium]